MIKLENYERVGKGKYYSTQKEQSMARDIKKLQKLTELQAEKIKVLEECQEFYQIDLHIRDYGNGQQVILESGEVAEDDEGNSLPNYAGRTAEKCKEIDERIKELK